MVWFKKFNGNEEKEEKTDKGKEEKMDKGKEEKPMEYEDDYCRLDATHLTIKYYYYPLGLSRNFTSSRITEVHCAIQGLTYGNTWG